MTTSMATISSWTPFLVEIPPVVFLVFLPIRLLELSATDVKARSGRLRHVKVVLCSALAIAQLIPLILSSYAPNGWQSHATASAVSFIAAIGLCLLMFFEHTRSVRPSSLAVLYIVAAIICDGITIFDTAIQPSINTGITIVAILRVTLLMGLLLCEGRSKQSKLKRSYQTLSPEEMSSIFGRTFFWWVNDILREGHQKILDPDSLPATDSKLSSKMLRTEMLHSWNARALPEGKFSLPLALLQCLKNSFLVAIIPRLFLIVFRYSQAILIKVTIQYVSSSNKKSGTGSFGCTLVVSALFIYSGMAISTAVYQHSLNRLQIMIKGALIGLIHHRSLTVKSHNYGDQNAVSLMSTDVDSIESVGEMLHETWAQIVEVTIGTVLLAHQIGWLSLMPLYIIYLCSHMSRFVAKHLQPRQKAWSIATQERVTAVTAMLGGVKSMKMLGLSDLVMSQIEDSRIHEIKTSKHLRWMMVAYNASANALGIFSPVITLVTFAIITKYKREQSLSADTAFPAIAILAMVTHPANMVLTIVPRAIASMANFERIQSYLTADSREDHRLILTGESERTSKTALINTQYTKPALKIEKLSIQTNFAADPILDEIDLEISIGSISMCSGRVGTGKTCLAMTILGEITPSKGSISVFTKRIGYCAQVPWLPSASIRSVICGSSYLDKSYDIRWYNVVIDACGLGKDIEELPVGDMTLIGFQGQNLSGGQRQRLALARAVYARYEFLILDDPFSSLDSRTENHIVQKLLGTGGVFKTLGTTVFLITNAAQLFSLSDQVIILGKGRIQATGPWEVIMDGYDSHIKKILMPDEEPSYAKFVEPDSMKDEIKKRAAEDAARDLTRKTGDMSLYGYYLKSVGVSNALSLIIFTFCYSFFLTFAQYWLKWWTESGVSQTWFYVGGYLIITVVAWLATNGTMWSTHIKIAPRSGLVLHSRLLSAIIGAPLTYFSHTDIGITLNRFGQDIQLVDRQLPSALANICNQIFKLAIQTVLLFGIQKALIATLPLCTAVVFVIQRIYLRTSRQLRFIELESKSAIYTSFLETTAGVATIRAFEWENKMAVDNIQRLDKSQGFVYLLLCLQRWLNLVLDLVIASIGGCVIALAISYRNTTSGADVGVALNLVLVANTTLLRLVECWTTLEISLGAISRIKSTVQDTPHGNKVEETLCPPTDWPSSGTIQLNNVSVSYNSSVLALSDITLDIEGGQRVLICGKTGSGKSTLLLALLDLIKVQAGSIKIDDIDITRVPRHILQQRCFVVVPQDAFILRNSSLRLNIDMSGTLSDEVLITALSKTHLWEHFASCHRTATLESDFQDSFSLPELKKVLDMTLSTLSPLSVGQLQLMSLTRAILRLDVLRNSSEASYRPILVLDEATSSLDPETDRLMQDIIQKEFSLRGHTIIAVSHRTLVPSTSVAVDANAIVWMESGRIVKTQGLKRDEFV